MSKDHNSISKNKNQTLWTILQNKLLFLMIMALVHLVPNMIDGTCWLKHCYRKKFYECWWYRGLWKFAVDLECIFLNNVKRP